MELVQVFLRVSAAASQAYLDKESRHLQVVEDVRSELRLAIPAFLLLARYYIPGIRAWRVLCDSRLFLSIQSVQMSTSYSFSMSYLHTLIISFSTGYLFNTLFFC